MGYELKIRTTEADWDAVEHENPLAKQMRTAQRHTEDVIEGVKPVCYLSGGAGVGKSHAIKLATAAVGQKVTRVLPLTHLDLQLVFDESDGKTPLIFEECDHLFRSPRCLNLLKVATDTAGVRSIVVRVPPKKRGEESTFKTIRLTAPIVFALNGNLLNSGEWPKDCLPHIEALLDREPPFNIEADAEAWWEYATYLAVRKRMLFLTENRKKRVPMLIQNKAIAWFADTAWQQSQLSPRRLVKIANVFLADAAAKQRAERSGRKYNPGDLSDDLQQFLKPGVAAGNPPYAPLIFVSEAAQRAA